MQKKPTNQSAKSQLSNFKKTARELEVDESEKAFDKALGKIGKVKPKAKP